ncbi:MAG: hypothetical protein AB7N76_14915 [Planctomycetota bacterium]
MSPPASSSPAPSSPAPTSPAPAPPGSPPSAPPGAPRATPAPAGGTVTPLPSDPKQLRAALAAEWKRLKALPDEQREACALDPARAQRFPLRGPIGRCPLCKGQMVQLSLPAGSYSEAKIDAICCAAERIFLLRITGGAMVGTVQRSEGPFVVPE